MSDKDGGAAFPISDPLLQNGMSLRDWFAGQALAGVVTGMNSTQRRRYIDEKADGREAEFVYRMADAMIAERAK